MGRRQAIIVLALTLGAAGCDDFRSKARQSSGEASTPVSATTSPPAVAPPPAQSQSPLAAAIETATVQADGAAIASPVSTKSPTPSNVIIRAEALLDQAHFSPGVIDGLPGQNLTNALKAYQTANGLEASGTLDAATLEALAKANPAPVTQDYAITDADEAGPFIGPVPDDFVQLAKLDHTGYHDVIQALAAKFHMSEGLLKALNPDADFTKSGTRILVVQPGAAVLPTPAQKLEVDKTNEQLRVYDSSGKIEAVFPATVGSTERPAPTGELTVLSVTPNPNYTYDPSKLTFGPKSHGKLTIKPGPNNPVGTTWIAVDNNGDGIHGTPDPSKVGKTASHGCVRLTNWDAETLRSAVSKGTPVDFIGIETHAKTPEKA